MAVARMVRGMLLLLGGWTAVASHLLGVQHYHGTGPNRSGLLAKFVLAKFVLMKFVLVKFVLVKFVQRVTYGNGRKENR